jgi:hypothetical protein
MSTTNTTNRRKVERRSQKAEVKKKLSVRTFFLPDCTRVRARSFSFFTSAFCLLTSAFLLCGCSRTDRWQETSIQTGSSKYDSSRLLYVAEDRVNGIDLELLQTPQGLKIYLLVHSSPVAPYGEEGKKSLVRISTEKEKKVILATRREGGQRLLLPETIYPFILTALKEKEWLTLQLSGYETRISPGKFKEKFEKLEHPSKFDVKVNLPI